MSENFLEAIEQGRKAAVDAELNLREIRAVVADLDAQVRELSGGVVGVSEGPWPRAASNYMPPVKGAAPSSPPRRRNALVLQRADTEERLCEFEPGPAGYPVEIRYEGAFTLARGRTELVAALKDVLATPQAGRALNALLDPSAARKAG